MTQEIKLQPLPETIDDAKDNLASLFFQCARYERPSTDWIAALDSFTEQVAIAALAAQPSVPAWHDAPTVPGLWVCQLNGQAYRWPNQYINASVSRWFGPIPEETK